MDELCRRFAAMKPAVTPAQKVPNSLFIMATFMKRCVQPLQHRVHPMWEDTGTMDEARLFHEDLSNVVLVTRVSRVARGTKGQAPNLKCPMAPFNATNPPPVVR